MEISFNATDAEQLDRLENAVIDLLHDASNGFGGIMNGLSNEELGALFREYVDEAEHANWEGFTFAEVYGFHAVLGDIARYHNAR